MKAATQKNMSFEVQRVVVIVDASGDVSLSAIKWALQGLPLKPGDKLLLLGVLHQVISPSMLSKAGKLRKISDFCSRLGKICVQGREMTA